MRKIRKLMFSPAAAVLVMWLFAVPASADEGIDLARECSISVGIHAYATDEAVGGGSLNLYQVAEVIAPEGEAMYRYTDGFAGCDEELLGEEALALSSTAETFAQWAGEHGLSADETVTVGTEGTAYFYGLSVGLYMVTQESAADGYNPINAFLVTLPAGDGGTWIYDVDASPKTSPAVEIETGKAVAGAKTDDGHVSAGYVISGTAAAAAVIVAALRRRKTRRTET